MHNPETSWKDTTHHQPEHAPFGGFGPDLPCYPPLPPGSSRFEVDDRGTHWGSEIPTSGSASVFQVKHCGPTWALGVAYFGCISFGLASWSSPTLSGPGSLASPTFSVLNPNLGLASRSGWTGTRRTSPSSGVPSLTKHTRTCLLFGLRLLPESLTPPGEVCQSAWRKAASDLSSGTGYD